MILFPAIDVRGGRCVRLQQGRAERETVYDEDPLAVARSFQTQGAEWLHLVDLDAAMDSSADNLAVIRRILAALEIPVQVGGGLRTPERIEAILDAGAARAIVGSLAAEQPEVLREAGARWGERLVVGVDARQGRIATHGWKKLEKVRVLDFVRSLEESGIRRIIYTEIERDGLLSGPAVDATVELARQSSLRVIASGGVSSLDDLKQLAQRSQGGIEGVVVGKALYERRFTVAEALAALDS